MLGMSAGPRLLIFFAFSLSLNLVRAEQQVPNENAVLGLWQGGLTPAAHGELQIDGRKSEWYASTSRLLVGFRAKSDELSAPVQRDKDKIMFSLPNSARKFRGQV